MNENHELWSCESLPELIKLAYHKDLGKTLDNVIKHLNDFRGETPLEDDSVLIGCEILLLDKFFR